MNKKSLYLLGILGIIILIFFYLKFRKEHIDWNEELLMLNGDKLAVHFDNSNRAYYKLLPHIAFGGGGDKIDFSLNFKGKSFKYQSKYIPIVIQKWKGKIYIVLYKYFGWERLLKFLVIDDNIKEISAFVFPKNIAIQNREFNDSADSIKNLFGEPIKSYYINPEDNRFRKSLTAQLWFFLETGKGTVEIWGKEINEDFLTKYISKYIEPAN
ncbi:MAG: hypothetical protein MUO31_06065 [Thermodesulfovibrionales bacterium]|nr:hypothetical protein [Thermodesulfovibrionales bacterium]